MVGYSILQNIFTYSLIKHQRAIISHSFQKLQFDFWCLIILHIDNFVKIKTFIYLLLPKDFFVYIVLAFQLLGWLFIIRWNNFIFNIFFLYQSLSLCLFLNSLQLYFLFFVHSFFMSKPRYLTFRKCFFVLINRVEMVSFLFKQLCHKLVCFIFF